MRVRVGIPRRFTKPPPSLPTNCSNPCGYKMNLTCYDFASQFGGKLQVTCGFLRHLGCECGGCCLDIDGSAACAWQYRRYLCAGGTTSSSQCATSADAGVAFQLDRLYLSLAFSVLISQYVGGDAVNPGTYLLTSSKGLGRTPYAKERLLIQIRRSLAVSCAAHQKRPDRSLVASEQGLKSLAVTGLHHVHKFLIGRGKGRNGAS